MDTPIAELVDEQPKRRRKRSTTPTQRTMAECRRRGWTAQIVEHRVPRVNVLRDLFGVIDVVALTNDEPPQLVGIQACSGVDHARRRDKVIAEPRAALWTRAGARLEIWSWSKRGDRGKRKLWALRVETYSEMHHIEQGKAAA
jgi:hypothetical protein